MTCEDIIKKKFHHAFIGYEVSEVDSFLDDVIREMGLLQAKLEELRKELCALRGGPSAGSDAEPEASEADIDHAAGLLNEAEMSEMELEDEKADDIPAMLRSVYSAPEHEKAKDEPALEGASRNTL